MTLNLTKELQALQQQHSRRAVLVSTFRSQEVIAAHLRKTVPNPLVLLYH